ncbi:MAG: hypothetical protein J1G38_04660 [Clostridiales bacterium]|nr:hypothetical protein [Clostridiales bacterium]
MAKKVVVPAEAQVEDGGVKQKKKRSKCCTCLIVFAIVSVVIIAVIFGVGWYFGDKYSQQFFGMSLGDTLGVLNDLYWTDDDDVVTRKYSKKDLNSFYDEIKKNMLLKSDAPIDFDKALLDAVNNYFSSEQGGENGEQENGEEAGGVNASLKNAAEGEEDGNAVLDILVGMLSNVFTKENLDIERLEQYDEDNDTYVFELKDKSLAAFVDAVLQAMLGNASEVDFLSDVNDMMPLKKVVKLKQIKYVVQAKKDEQGMKLPATAAEITVWLGMQDAAGYAIKHFLKEAGVGWAGGFVAWLGDVILPENVYVRLTIPLEDAAEPGISFNTMNNAERKRMYKLVNGVFKNIMHEDMTVDSLLKDFADMVKPFLGQATELMDFSKAGKGTISFDLLGTVAEKMSEESFKDDPITKSDIMYMLQALLTTSPDARMRELEPYLYKAWYANADGSGAVYKYDDTVDTTGKKLVDYGSALIREIEDAYSLDFGDAASISEVMSMLGISLDGGGSGNVDTDSLLGKINKEKFQASLDPNTQIRKLRITDRMLASALSGQLDAMLANGGVGMENLSIELDALTFVSDGNYPGHTFALIAVEVGIGDMLSSIGDNAFIGVISGLVPDRILMSMQLDITKSLAAGDSYAPAQFKINDYNKTQIVIDTLKKIVPDLDLTGITGQIEGTLRDMVLEMDKILGVDLVPSDLSQTPVTSGAMLLPDIYTAVVNTLLTDDDGKPVITNEELRHVLYGLNHTEEFGKYEGGENYIDDSPSGFIAEVVDKYYLNPPNELTSFDELTAFLATGDSQSFGDKFRLKYEEFGVNTLAYDVRTVEELMPLMTGAQLGGLIRQQMPTMGDVNDLFELLDIGITASEISIVLGVGMQSLVPEAVQNLLSVNKLYVTATADISTVNDGAYPVEFTVNSMNEADIENLMKILGKLGGSFDIDAKTDEFGKTLYEKLDGLMSSMGDGLLRFTDGGIELASFYEFLASKLGIENENEDVDNVGWAKTVKAAVQGMFEWPKDEYGAYYDIEEFYGEGVERSDVNNYRLDEFVVNPPDPEYSFDDVDFSKIVSTGSLKWSDRKFNAWVQETLSVNNVISSQTIALAGGDGSDKAVGVRTWLNGKDKGGIVSEGEDYIIITFKLAMGQFGDANSDTATGFMPSGLYATIVLRNKGEEGGEQTGFECVGTVVNDLNEEAYALMLRLMGLSTDSTDSSKVNINSITQDCVNKVNELFTIGDNIKTDMSISAMSDALLEDDGSIGAITLTLKSVGPLG